MSTLTIDTSSRLDALLPEGRRKHYWRDYLYVLAAAMAFYVVTMAPGVLWQDSGLAQVRTIRRDFDGGLGLALSHPLYYLFTSVFQVIPFGESAWKTNLVSAVFGAVTVANLFQLLRRTTNCFASPLAGAISLAVAHTFWQHCALAEVYTLSTALLTAELLCLERFLDSGRARWLCLMMFASGLGLSNHVLALLSLACYGVLGLWLMGRRGVRPVVVLALAAAWAAGAVVYMWMIASRLEHGADPLVTLREALVGRGYASKVLNPFPSARQLVNSAMYMGLNFPTPTVLLAVAGLAGAWRARHSVITVVVLALLAVHFVFAVRYDVPDQYTFFIPSIVLISALIGWGMEAFGAPRLRIVRRVGAACCLLPVFVYVPLPEIARALRLNLGSTQQIAHRDAYAYYLHPWKTGERGPEQFAQDVLSALPEDSFLWADGTTGRPIQYLQITRGLRTDISVFPPVSPRLEDDGRYQEERLEPWLGRGKFFVVTPRYPYVPRWLADGYLFEPYGIVHRVVGRSRPRTQDPGLPATPAP